jgi:hypothetical protein
MRGRTRVRNGSNAEKPCDAEKRGDGAGGRAYDYAVAALEPRSRETRGIDVREKA